MPCAVLAVEASFPGGGSLRCFIRLPLKRLLSTTGLRGLMGKWD